MILILAGILLYLLIVCMIMGPILDRCDGKPFLQELCVLASLLLLAAPIVYVAVLFE